MPGLPPPAGAPGFPEEPQEEPHVDDGVVDADFEIKKDPWLHRVFPSLKRKKEKKAGLVTYWTFERVETDYGTGTEYEAREHQCKRSELPRAAVHITGMKGVYCVVDMEPIYPEYADPDAEVDENGNFVRPHNYFDAFGYYKYFTDQRIKRGYDALGRMDRYKLPLDWKTVGMIAIAAVVFLVVVSRFL